VGWTPVLRSGYGFAKQVVAHYVTTLRYNWARSSSGSTPYTDERQTPNVAQRADVQGVPAGSGEPDPRDAELTFPFINLMPVPYVEPEDVSEAVLFSRPTLRAM